MSADVHGLSGAYAVDALEEPERAAFEQHLAQCRECQAEVASLRETATTLSALAATTPPPSLRASVLQQIRTVRPLPPLTARDGSPGEPTLGAPPAGPSDPPAGPSDPPAGPSDPPAGPSDPPAGPTAGEDGTVVPLRPRRRVVGWLAAAAAAAVFAVGGLAWSPWDDSEQPASVTEQVIAADDAQRFEKAVDGARATIVRSPSLGKAVLITDNMPAPPPGRDYQLWYDIPGRGMVSAGLMPREGKPTATVLLQGDAAAAAGAGITVEPAGGSTKPTSDPVALFTFS